jgi:hypothetical protein
MDKMMIVACGASWPSTLPRILSQTFKFLSTLSEEQQNLNQDKGNIFMLQLRGHFDFA